MGNCSMMETLLKIPTYLQNSISSSDKAMNKIFLEVLTVSWENLSYGYWLDYSLL